MYGRDSLGCITSLNILINNKFIAMMDTSSDSGIVGLNVGGKIYKTSRATLTRYPDSFFSGLLEGSVPSAKDDQGNYFIDQDGEIFRHVLNFLRYGKVVLPEEFTDFNLLERVADFFLIDELKLALKAIESIGIAEESGRAYMMSRESLLREPDSLFAKMVGDAETPVLKDSKGNFVIANTGSTSLPFQHILQFLKVGGIFSDVTANSSHYLEEKARQFGLEVLSDQINMIMHARYVLTIYYWLNGPCILYLDCDNSKRSIEGLIREVCHVNMEIEVSDCRVVAGLVNVQKLPFDTSQLDLMISYFLERSTLHSSETTPVTNNCLKVVFT